MSTSPAAGVPLPQAVAAARSRLGRLPDVPSDRLMSVTVVLVGPTAVGKSALAVALAERFAEDRRPAEVVNADSMLLYRGMDIGTAKPTEVERRNIPHHLIDILDVGEP